MAHGRISLIFANTPGTLIVLYGLTESAGGIIYDGIPNIGIDIKIVEAGTE